MGESDVDLGARADAGNPSATGAHCRVIEPVLQQVAGMVKATEKIYRVNNAVDQELVDSYEILGTPTLVMFLTGTKFHGSKDRVRRYRAF